AENLKLIGEADHLVLVGFDPIELRDAWLDAWPEPLGAGSISRAALNHRIFPLGEEALGDVASILGQLLPEANSAARAGWPAQRIAAHRDRVSQIVRPRSPARGISPAALFAAVSARSTADWIMTVDVGAHRILANHVI